MHAARSQIGRLNKENCRRVFQEVIRDLKIYNIHGCQTAA
jgi:hypothetical protein